MTLDTPFVVSSPGKVIIFGEHSAVYGKPAIAAGISLRTYLLVSNSENTEDITLDFPDIGFKHTWKRSELPWDLVDKLHVGKPNPTDELVPELTSELAQVLSNIDKSIHYAAAYSFLYLYVNLCSKNHQGITFTVRSTLPIGAGLGSSASISVCLSAALSLLGNHINPATLKTSDISSDNDDILFIDSWAFMGEKCIQGNPSGIDNAVATHGGAVMFQRTQSSTPSVRTTMRNFPTLKLLLTNTKHPRRSADLVSGVGVLANKYPKTTGYILDAMDDLTRQAYTIVIKPFVDEDDKQKLKELFEINHGLLVSLGVSHPSLEKIRILTDELKVGKTKLTGAGGGGCAITLLNDDVKEETINELTKKYDEFGFETFETSLGGKGVGLLTNDSVKFSFLPEDFLNLSSRNDIEATLNSNSLESWKFW